MGLAVEDWESLVYSIQRGRCILMLGPDAIECEYDGQVGPVLDSLAKFLQRRLTRELPYANADFGRASAVAQAVLTASPGKRRTLVSWVEEFYQGRTFDGLAQLAALPFELVVNTAPGVPVERAFDAVKPNRSVAFYDYQGNKSDLMPSWSADAPLIYHLYGSLERPSSIVVSDSDQLNFLEAVIRGDPPLPANLTSTFRTAERSYLFLGFRLHQWQLRILMHVLDDESDRTSRSYAFEQSSGDVDQGTRNFYSSGHRIDFFDLPVSAFLAELKGRVGDSPAPSSSDSAATPAPDSPAVFICHASEDAATANDLAVKLRGNGVNTWLDKDEIRGGQGWDALIERTLRSEVGYVVVLQSENLAEKRERRSYVNKEIKISLDVQSEFPPKRVFLLPAFISDPPTLIEELDGIQSTDITTQAGFDQLIKTIKRDIQRGQRQ